MASVSTEILSPENALIFRITHRSNVPWILENGLHCRRSDIMDPDFVSIGNPELIERRCHRVVELSPGGTLEDYVPFYFTPFSPMLLNIKTGWGVKQRGNDEIVILISSLPALEANDVSYVFTDRHAYLKTANFFGDRNEIETAVDYPLLRSRNFTRDSEHPENFERYQAEALAYRHVPVDALIGVGCYTSAIKDEIETICSDLQVDLKVVVRNGWYF